MFEDKKNSKAIIVLSLLSCFLLLGNAIIPGAYSITAKDFQSQLNTGTPISKNEIVINDISPFWNTFGIKSDDSIAISERTGPGTVISSAPSSFKENVEDAGCSIEKVKRNNINSSGGVYGEAYTDLTGTNENDLLIGESEDERISAKRGDDIVQSSDGKDLIFGNGGKDRLQGGSLADSIFGEDDDDMIIAGDGDDYLCGGSGNDILYAGTGDDILEGGKGLDFFDCGEGIDLVLDFSLAEKDIVNTNCEYK